MTLAVDDEVAMAVAGRGVSAFSSSQSNGGTSPVDGACGVILP
jgi:hypothetical protein